MYIFNFHFMKNKLIATPNVDFITKCKNETCQIIKPLLDALNSYTIKQDTSSFVYTSTYSIVMPYSTCYIITDAILNVSKSSINPTCDVIVEQLFNKVWSHYLRSLYECWVKPDLQTNLILSSLYGDKVDENMYGMVYNYIDARQQVLTKEVFKLLGEENVY